MKINIGVKENKRLKIERPESIIGG